MTKFRLTCLVWGLLLITQLAHGKQNYPGGFAEIRVAKQNEELPQAKFGLRDVLIQDKGQYWRLIVGIGLDVLPGEYVVYFKHGVEGSSGQHLPIKVQQNEYPFSSSTIKTPMSAPQMLTQKELNTIDFVNSEQATFPLRFPIDTGWSNTFGYRSYNQDQELVVTDIELRAHVTNPVNIVAPQDGILSNIIMHEDLLSTLVIDHGRGAHSVIHGVTDLTVEIGNGVRAGSVIAKAPEPSVGNQNFIRWQFVLNGAYVNPRIFTEIN